MPARLCHLPRRIALLAVLVGIGCAQGACSLSYDLDSMFSKSGATETTGSVSKKAADAMAAELPPEADLALARTAVNEVLTRGSKDASIPWENPKSGARGTVTPIASAYTIDQAQCRDFLASYVKGGKESWLRGEACRQDNGRWQVRALKPWIGS